MLNTTFKYNQDMNNIDKYKPKGLVINYREGAYQMGES